MTQILYYLNKLCDEALGNTTASFCSEVVSHEESQRPDSTGSDGDLKNEDKMLKLEKQCGNSRTRCSLYY